MLCGVHLDSDDSVEEDDLLDRQQSSKLGNACRYVLAFGSSLLIVLGSFQSIVYFSAQNYHIGYQTLICALATGAHCVTVTLCSRTSCTSSKANLFIGCLISALSTALIYPAFSIEPDSAIQRSVQELGFAMVLHALPAVFWNQMPTSVQFSIPMLAVIRASATISMPVLNGSLGWLGPLVPYALSSAGFVLMAVICCFAVDGTLDCRRPTARWFDASRPKLSWSIVFVTLVMLNNIVTVAFVQLVCYDTFRHSQDSVRLAVQLLPSAGLYLVAGPLAAISIRWLPPRGLVLMLTVLLNVALLAALNYVSRTLLVLALSALSLSCGAQVVLFHMHLVEGISERIRARHNVPAARITSTVFSIGIIVSFLLPTLFELINQHSELKHFAKNYPCLAVNCFTLLTVVAVVVKETCAA